MGISLTEEKPLARIGEMHAESLPDTSSTENKAQTSTLTTSVQQCARHDGQYGSAMNAKSGQEEAKC